MFAVVEYAWPPIAYEIKALFRDEIKREDISTCDAKILALKDDLKFTRQHKDQVSKGFIEITLPIPVKNSSEHHYAWCTDEERWKQGHSSSINCLPNQLHNKTRRRKIVLKISSV
jgi:hypothetical protein